uniref:Uncharacterized protein n=1 Tax=uncultured prokaryote TaxID=198431 RepID=A0A0H5Q3H7_9ZZZZ|nr:hypothetical protein [uncultured prokaryote]
MNKHHTRSADARIYGPPAHRLRKVTVTLEVPDVANELRTSVSITGYSDTMRTSLWTVHESWSWTEQAEGLQPADAIHHALLVALQDKPQSQHQFECCMVGEGWRQDSLFD